MKFKNSILAATILLASVGVCAHADGVNIAQVVTYSSSNVSVTSETALSDLATSTQDLSLSNPFDEYLPSPTTGNASNIAQDGNNNVVSLDVIGQLNRTAQIQNGGDNYSNISINGEENDAYTLQNGYSNSAIISILGNLQTIGVEQTGNGLSMTIERTGSGSGTPIIIRQGGS